MWCSKLGSHGWRPLPTLNATFPSAPHNGYGSSLGPNGKCFPCAALEIERYSAARSIAMGLSLPAGPEMPELHGGLA
jgi:hypothetical protein